jgi:hypothetical protein
MRLLKKAAAATATTSSNNAATEEQGVSDSFVDAPEDRNLLTLKRLRISSPDDEDRARRRDWMRPYWLGTGLFLVLLSFWVIDSLKDPIFGQLVDGKLDRHQPPAKVFSVCTTLALVCFLEYVSNERQRQQQVEKERSHEEVLSGGGRWASMEYSSSQDRRTSGNSDPNLSGTIFVSIGVPYCIVFGIMAYLLQFHPSVAMSLSKDNVPAAMRATDATNFWHVVGYFWYAAIESFGSIAVATFWSYVNSTLSLKDAEQYYGSIVGMAQLGAIIGSTVSSKSEYNKGGCEVPIVQGLLRTLTHSNPLIYLTHRWLLHIFGHQLH